MAGCTYNKLKLRAPCAANVGKGNLAVRGRSKAENVRVAYHRAGRSRRLRRSRPGAAS